MNKKLIIIISILLLIVFSICLYLLFKNNNSSNSVKNNESEEVNLDKDLNAKAMIYVADKYNYTTEDYIIDVQKNNDSYIVTINNKENSKVDEVTINENKLKTWQPTTESPEKTETIVDGVSESSQ